MLSICPPERLRAVGPTELSDALERGEIVAFPFSPVPFPAERDLLFLREELPGLLRGKNVSFHPESDRVVGLGASRGVRERAREILREHSRHVRDFLRSAVPVLAAGWKVGTSSFRPLEEKGGGSPSGRATSGSTWMPAPMGRLTGTGSSASS